MKGGLSGCSCIAWATHDAVEGFCLSREVLPLQGPVLAPCAQLREPDLRWRLWVGWVDLDKVQGSGNEAGGPGE